MPPFRVCRSLDAIPPDFGPCAVTVGNFDGVHIGHAALFRRVADLARERGWKPSALTFDPHPARVVAPDRAPKLLSSLDERLERIRCAGIEQVVVLPFTPEFSCLTPAEFCRDILAARLAARAVLIGWNFRFGQGQAGDPAELARQGELCGFEVEIVPGLRFRGRIVSSSEIRRLLAVGDVVRAGRLLGREFTLVGAVVPGRGIGSSQTVPTLNLRSGAEVLPARGVYVTRTSDPETGREWPSVTNVGYRPTFKGENLSIETHLLAPLEGPDPAHIRVAFLRRLRDEMEFASAEALKRQIWRDAARAAAYHRRRRVLKLPGGGVRG